jgi:hypothetical protein
LPGERREVTVSVRQSDLAGAQPTLLVDGYNSAVATVHESQK